MQGFIINDSSDPYQWKITALKMQLNQYYFLFMKTEANKTLDTVSQNFLHTPFLVQPY